MITGKTQIIRQKKIEICNINMPTVSLTEPDQSSHGSLSTSSPDGDIHSQSDGQSVETEHSTSPTIDFEQKCRANINKNVNSNEKSKIPNSNSKTLTSIINNGSKLQISSALRERLRRSKSPNPNRITIMTNNSMPNADNKLSKLTNFSNRLSAGSFFSKSCQGEELTNELSKKDIDGSKNLSKSG